MNNANATVILVVAHTDYQPVEYGVTYDILASNTIQVATVSNKPGVATATDGSTTVVNNTLDEINPINYQGLFIIGGKGALEHLNIPVMHELLRQFKALGKPYGAICIAPRILAQAQVLGTVKATGWDDDHELARVFERYGAQYTRKAVVTDGLVVTAQGPEVVQDFAEAIIRVVQAYQQEQQRRLAS